MLKGIPKIISPELLKVLMEMGHSDRIVISDGNFPAESVGKNARVIRADGHGVPEILDAILKLMPLDTYVDCPVSLMQVMPGDNAKTPIWDTYKEIVMFTGSESHPAMTIRFEDGRCAYMHQSMDLGFRLSIDDNDNNGKVYNIESDFFALFIKNLVEFFEKGEVPVEHSQTIDVIAIREAGLKAMKTPFEWVQV